MTQKQEGGVRSGGLVGGALFSIWLAGKIVCWLDRSMREDLMGVVGVGVGTKPVQLTATTDTFRQIHDLNANP